MLRAALDVSSGKISAAAVAVAGTLLSACLIRRAKQVVHAFGVPRLTADKCGLIQMKNDNTRRTQRFSLCRPATTLLALCCLGAASAALADVSNPVIGNLLFEDNFNNLNTSSWNQIEGDGCAIGLCG